MKDTEFKIVSNIEIARDTYQMMLSGDARDCERPGTFVNVHVDSLYLRRPISVCYAKNDEMQASGPFYIPLRLRHLDCSPVLP